MTRAGAEGAVVTSALIVGAVYGYRKLLEPTVSAAGQASSGSSALLAIAGAEPAPASLAQFAIGYGFTYMVLSVLAAAAPALAGSMAILIAAGDVLTNGGAIARDVSGQVAAEAPAKHPARKAAK